MIDHSDRNPYTDSRPTSTRMTEPEKSLDAGEGVEKAVQELNENEVVDFIMESTYGELSNEPRTIHGDFPGSKDRAMGHALEVVRIAEEAGLEAEREYVGQGDEYENQHLINIHIEGGS